MNTDRADHPDPPSPAAEGLDPRSMTPAALERAVARLGGRAEHAARLLAHVVKLGRVVPDGLRRMPRRVVDAVPWLLRRLRPVECRVSRVYLFHKLAYETHDGRIVESVLIPVTQGGSRSACPRRRLPSGAWSAPPRYMPRPRSGGVRSSTRWSRGSRRRPPVRAVVFLGM